MENLLVLSKNSDQLTYVEGNLVTVTKEDVAKELASEPIYYNIAEFEQEVEKAEKALADAVDSLDAEIMHKEADLEAQVKSCLESAKAARGAAMAEALAKYDAAVKAITADAENAAENICKFKEDVLAEKKEALENARRILKEAKEKNAEIDLNRDTYSQLSAILKEEAKAKAEEERKAEEALKLEQEKQAVAEQKVVQPAVVHLETPRLKF